MRVVSPDEAPTTGVRPVSPSAKTTFFYWSLRRCLRPRAMPSAPVLRRGAPAPRAAERPVGAGSARAVQPAGSDALHFRALSRVTEPGAPERVDRASSRLVLIGGHAVRRSRLGVLRRPHRGHRRGGPRRLQPVLRPDRPDGVRADPARAPRSGGGRRGAPGGLLAGLAGRAPVRPEAGQPGGLARDAGQDPSNRSAPVHP